MGTPDKVSSKSGPLPAHDLLVECAQSFVRGWTETSIRTYVEEQLEAERRRILLEIKAFVIDNVNPPATGDMVVDHLENTLWQKS